MRKTPVLLSPPQPGIPEPKLNLLGTHLVCGHRMVPALVGVTLYANASSSPFPLQKQSGACLGQSRTPRGADPPIWDSLPIGAAGHLPHPTRWMAPSLTVGPQGSQHVPEARSRSDTQIPVLEGLLPLQLQGLPLLLPNWSHLLSLDIILDLGYLDLHGIQLLVQHQRDAGSCLRLVHRLEAEIREWDVPLAVILLGFAG